MNIVSSASVRNRSQAQAGGIKAVNWLELLNANMIRVQDEERKGLARELHDSASSILHRTIVR
jgi:signal transduction histidine kinase